MSHRWWKGWNLKAYHSLNNYTGGCVCDKESQLQHMACQDDELSAIDSYTMKTTLRDQMNILITEKLLYNTAYDTKCKIGHTS